MSHEPLASLPPVETWRAPFSVAPPEAVPDPATFEIVRHRLWYAGMTIGETLKKVSGTIVVSEAQDMSTYITLPDSAPVFLGPYVLLHAGIASLVVENAARVNRESGGVRPGDMYFVNDPWMGVAHQPDCAIVAPLFVGGELLAWTGVTLHQLDMGGIDPGGVCPHARDAHSEPTVYPAVKIVERGRLRADIDRLLRRNSRLPDVLALDIRSMIAANAACHRDLREIVERYGAATVRDVMRKMVADSYEAFGRRLRELPRGRFRARDFFETGGYAPELSEQVYEVDLTLVNDGERLVFDFSGTSPQASGFVNCGFGGQLGGVLGSLLQQLAHDIPWNGGVIARLELRSQPQTVNNPTWPAAVSGGVTEGAISTGTAAAGALGHLVLGAPPVRERMTLGAGSIFLGSTLGGMNPDGTMWGTLLMDPIGMGGAATSVGDGIDLCGSGAIPYTQFANVESAERNYPILYLFRRVARDAFSFGRWRGGQALEFAFKLHGTPAAMLLLWCHGAELPNVLGICGAGPSAGARFLLARDAGVQAAWSQGRLPTELEEFEFDALPAKTEALIGPDDVVLFGVPGGAGYGDPLERDPQAVAADVRFGRLSPEAARNFFGVALDGRGAVDAPGTRKLRGEMIERRRAEASRPEAVCRERADGPIVVDAGDGLCVREAAGRLVWACTKCGHVYCGAGDNPRQVAAVRLGRINDVGHPFGQLVRAERPRFFLREFFCPECLLRFAVEVARPNADPPLFAIEYDPDWLEEKRRERA